jgi:predicted peroxiredoxin
MKKYWLLMLSAVLLAALFGRQIGIGQSEVVVTAEPSDGVFVHITAGPDDPHRVLMALQMAVLMSDSLPVAVYCDIDAVNVVTKEAPDLAFSHFPSSHSQIEKLVAAGVPVMACPGCLKAAGKSADDLMPGVQVADRAIFLSFTDGRILTLDY